MNMTTREAFEKWAMEHEFDLSINPAPNYDASIYNDDEVNNMWIGWQAAPNLEAKIAELEDSLRNMRTVNIVFTGKMGDYCKEIAELEATVEKMREALGYYKDAISIDDSACECGRGTQTLDDGYKAREALEGV